MARSLRTLVARDLPAFLPWQRWFGGKGRSLSAVSLLDCGPVGEGPGRLWLALVQAAFATGPAEIYAIPLAIRSDTLPEGRLVGQLTPEGTPLRAYDAFDDPEACLALLDRLARGETVVTERGRAQFTRTAAFPVSGLAWPPSIRRLRAEQSNTSVVYDEALILKAFRKLEPGPNPDREVTGFLTERTPFRHVPLLAGAVDYVGPGGLDASLAILQHFVPNRGDGWSFALEHLKRFFALVRGRPRPSAGERDRVARLIRELSGDFFAAAHRLGALTGALHTALASDPADPAFAPEPITDADVRAWTAALARQAEIALGDLRERIEALPPTAEKQARALLDREADLVTRARHLAVLTRSGCVKIRIHGDLHLGQTLRAGDGFVILDFEGEPARPLAERRAKHCPLKDVAGLLRSFDYAVAAALRELEAVDPPEFADTLGAWGDGWARIAVETLLEGYEAEATRAPARILPASREATAGALAVFELDKALYELRYEVNNRPDWLPIPLRGLTRLLARPAA